MVEDWIKVVDEAAKFIKYMGPKANLLQKEVYNSNKTIKRRYDVFGEALKFDSSNMKLKSIQDMIMYERSINAKDTLEEVDKGSYLFYMTSIFIKDFCE